MTKFIPLIPLLELPILFAMLLIRAAILKRQGIKAILFGATDKSDFILLPVIVCFLYALFAAAFDGPFPAVLKKSFWQIGILPLCATVLCTLSLIWFGFTLKTFGKSFRVGIDENTKNSLVKSGTFSLSRNPIYVAFITFFFGIFLDYPNIATLVFFIFLVSAIHRQILREEKFLATHYGMEYEEYCKKVRRYA